MFGWDHVTQGLVQLGFTLMDAFGPKMFGKYCGTLVLTRLHYNDDCGIMYYTE